MSIKTIQTAIWVPGSKKGTVKFHCMRPLSQIFTELKSRLQEKCLLPEEYFLFEGENIVNVENEAYWFTTDVQWGSSEGIFLDISLRYRCGNELKTAPVAVGKTLGQSYEDYIKMGRIAAEANFLLNGDGMEFKQGNRVYANPYSDVPMNTKELIYALGFDSNRFEGRITPAEMEKRLFGTHCECKGEGEFVLLPLNDEMVEEGQKRYMKCRKCHGYSHL